ncbi:MAG: hypothetical protein AB7I19_02625 [Planctomycetota bacterium]
MSQRWQVRVEERGREGTVHYRDEHGTLSFYKEIGGGDVVASVRMGTRSDWERDHRWALGRREEIIARVGSECIRQRAPGCRAEMDEAVGWLNLVLDGAAPTPQPAASTSAAAMVHRLTSLRRKMAMVVAILVAVAATVVWLAKSMFSISTTGTPIGDSARAGDIVATLIQRLEPYVPSLHRDASKDRYSIGILLHDLSGTVQPRYHEIGGGHTGGALSLSRLLGADGDWVLFQAPELGAIEVRSGRIARGEESEALRARIDAGRPASASPLAAMRSADRALLAQLASGGRVSPTRVMLLGDPATLAREHRIGGSIREVLDASRSREPVRPVLAEVVESNARTTVASLKECVGEPMFRAGFVRAATDGTLLILDEPRSVLCLHEPRWFPQSNVSLSRLDLDGKTIWQVDLGIDVLEQVIPARDRLVLRGKLPAAPSTVPAPVLVVVELRSGALATHPLLRTD